MDRIEAENLSMPGPSNELDHEKIQRMPRLILVCVALVVVTLAAYWPVFQNDFVNYDDPSYVTENPPVLGGLNWAGAQWAFQTNHAGNWHPLTWLSHMLDVTLFGSRPAGHHFTSLLFHIANSGLLFLALRSLTGATWRSAAVAGLFALHPVHVESVAWVAERKDVLSTFFFLLSLMNYTNYVHATTAIPKSSRRWVYHALAAFFFACGLMSKPMLVTVPFVLLLLDFWPLRRLQLGPLRPQLVAARKLIVEKIPFFALSAGSCVVTFIVQRDAGAVNSFDTVPLELRVANALISYVRYLGKVFWPEGLAVIYPFPHSWPIELSLGAALLLLGLSAVVLWQLKRAPYLATGWFWFIGTLLPVIGLIQVGGQAMADRYTYIPSIGLFVMIVWALAEIPGRWPSGRGWLAAGAVILAAACGVATWHQLTFWKNSRSLFEHALAVTRDNAVAENNFGVILMDYDGAEPHFANAVRIHPGYSEALANLAVCREKAGDVEGARQLLQRSLQSSPNASAYYNLANLLTKQNQLAAAEENYRAALRLKPEFVEAWFNLGILHGKQGRTEEANQDYATALRLKPNQADAHLTFGASLAEQKKFDEAIAEFNAALRLAPDNADAHFNLGFALQNKGDLSEAAKHFAEACRLRPDDVEARNALGFALLCQGKMSEAAPQFEQVLRARPDAKANYYLALALDAQGKTLAALTNYQQALRLAPTAALYMNDLAWLLATSANSAARNGAEAVRLAEEANRIAGGKEPRFMGTLDAAYAETGRFDEAIATAAKARELALAARQPDIAQAAEQRLAQYRQQKPWRQQPPPANPR